ncbi:hypothetical protein BCV69DRAFT_312394 [Microstroma glucosiphilum]|uniref:SUZ domain-containing protein n=1 Tax=Pseudomicrostroma glucosiphilum TaxID=1684307 RepID=A0A316U8F8_9BASI|nr:hypothetical protein BCV69DRAFT_312394 [Pseudomicrostroma glucosiphilum]PWN21134.1 hypothetical protein BCV69DRAFT_312394 [Pseudomicrostroma glucosiphilum]
MATRWKPTVKAKQAAAESSIIDDWENDEGEQSNTSPSAAADDIGTAKDSGQDAWPSLGSAAAPNRAYRSSPSVTLLAARSKSASSTPLQSASPAFGSPQAYPFSIAPRVTGPPTNLPPSALAPEPAPQILRRDPNSSASSSRAGSSSAEGDAANRRKTLQEREKEYEEARRRIFGDAPVKESAMKAGEGKGQAESNPDKRRGGKKGGSRSGSRSASGDGLQKSRSGTSTPEIRMVEGTSR